MEVTVELKGVREALETLNRVAKDGPKATQRALSAIAILVQREAIKNAPRSPMRKQLNRLRKTRRKVTRKARATSRPSPGGLERSIERHATSDAAYIFVASNSNAGKYAARIHDEKGSTWHNRGIGTQAKGSRADDKFIHRAIVDNEGKILEIIKAEHGKAGWYELR
jgi:hypothetical protein